MQALTQPSIVFPLIATTYVGVAGLTVLLYDHILLFDREVQCIWKAKNSWFKWLFLFNYYTVPSLLLVNSSSFGPVVGNVSTQFCKDWLSTTALLPAVSSGILNILVAHRVYALWGRNKTVLKVLCVGIGAAYAFTVVVVGIGIKMSYSSVIFDPIAHVCIAAKLSKLFAVGYSISLALDLLIFSLLCLNALDRPRDLHTVIIKQLYIDGVAYFLVMIVLQGINVALLAGILPIQYSLLFTFLTYAMATTIIHRMILRLNNDIDDPLDDSERHKDVYNKGVYVKTQWTNPYDLHTGTDAYTKTWMTT